MKYLNCSRAGTALVTSLVCAGIIASVCAVGIAFIQPRYRSVHQTASWKESLLTAEGGIEMAMNEIRKSLYDPEHAFEGWTASADPIVGEASNEPGASAQRMTYTLESSAVLRKGEGAQSSRAYVTVDAPRCLVDRSNEQWYRIRSLGVTDVPGAGGIAGEAQDLKLRKFDLVYDRRSGRKVMHPQAGRVIEAIAKPMGAFSLALFGTNSVNMNNHNIVVDSYDSRDNNKSTNGGYDVAKRQSNADVATNGPLINAGGAHVYGDAFTNGGTVLNAQNVTGEIGSEFYKDTLTVQRPNTNPDAGTPSVVNETTVIQANAETPSNFQFSTVSLSGSEVLEIQGAADGSATYAQIVVTGDISLSGKAQIKLGRGVYARIFVAGDADFSGQGFLNPNSPLALQLYGIDRPKNADGTVSNHGMMKISGNGGFCGAVYAPDYDIEMKGGGTTDTIFGAFVGHTISMTGVQSVHYDEALADGGLINDYKIVSWFEDER
jgi:hypothetical protein